MQIIEQVITGKTSLEKCEDAYIVTDNFAAVADGSTSKSNLPPLSCQLTHGQIASRCVCSYLAQCTQDIDLHTFCEGVTKALQEQYSIYRPELPLQHFSSHPEDRFTCSAIIYSAFRNEIWMIGDCHCLLTYADETSRYYDNPKPMEAVLAAQRSEHIKTLLAKGATVEDIRKDDKGRASIIPALKESMKAQNRDYAVIDGFPIPLDKVMVINAKGAENIILASDGYPQLFPTLAETEQYLQQLLANDPLLITEYQATKCWHPANSSFDDRCYIKIR